jgi:hypothetical protein
LLEELEDWTDILKAEPELLLRLDELDRKCSAEADNDLDQTQPQAPEPPELAP